MRYALRPRRHRTYFEEEEWAEPPLSIEVIEEEDDATGVLGPDGREYYRVKERPGFVW